MNSDSSLYLDEQQNTDSLGVDALSIALIGPDEGRRKTVASALASCQSGEVREFLSYPSSLDEVPRLLEQHYDVIIIGLDAIPEYALELVENICANDPATVMVYSEKADSELLVRCMRAGAREFLTLPFAQNTMAEALVRASARRPSARAPKKAGGRLLAFLGAKGGDGVTTLACNFAVSLAQESSQSVLLIDLDLPLGDAALNLGVVAEYSAINALQNATRLDSSFLSKLLVKHSSGVSVLAAPGRFPQFDASNEAIDKLLLVARQDFENVVIDMGSRLDLTGTSLFKDGSTIYLVIQAGIAGLRNSNRLISQYFTTDIPKLEIVLNRYQSRTLGVAEDQITKALTRPAQWKIPNDYAAVRRMQHTAVPLALEDSPISRLIRQMARSACGLPTIQEKGTGFSLKKISRSLTAKMSAQEDASAQTQLGMVSSSANAAAALDAVQSDAKANIAENAISATPSAPVADSEAQTSAVSTGAAEKTDVADAAVEGQQSVGIPKHPSEPETRTYRGSTYVRGADGGWHLQQALSQPIPSEATQAEQVQPESPQPEPVQPQPVQSEPTQPEPLQPELAQPEVVQKETPVIAWSSPAPIANGSALSSAELNAMASVPGTFVYTPAVGEVLPVGTHTLAVEFTPKDASGYTITQATAVLAVTKATPVITWPKPAAISYGTALSATQLNAAASVPGTFIYTPAAGEVLPAGEQTLIAAFTPTDELGCTAAPAAVLLTVTQATPTITWSVPAAIAYGTGLSAIQLNAAASVEGTFAYTPEAGAVLKTGAQTLSAAFTPADSANYATAKASVLLSVTKATPIITWTAPASISEGEALTNEQLNATALVPGTFIYTPASGEELPAGTHTLSVTFTPMDSAAYAAVQTNVSLFIAEAMPVIPLPEPAVIPQAIVPIVDEFHVEIPPAEPNAAPAEAVEPVPVAEPLPEIAPVKVSVETPAEEPANATIVPSSEAPARPSVKLSTETPDEATGTSLVKAGLPKSPIDVGPGLDLMGSAVFEDGTTIYLVLQPGSAGLTNANRLVSQFFGSSGPKPEIVINRFEPSSAEDAGDQNSAALIRPASSPFSSLIGQVARSASDIPAIPAKKTRFSLKGLSRSLWAKISSSDETQSMTQLGLSDERDTVSPPQDTTQTESMPNLPVRTAYASPASSLFAEGKSKPFTSTERPSHTDLPEAKRGIGQTVNAPRQHREPETRNYKGSTYLRGADGQWHLEESQTGNVKKELPLAAWPMPAPIYYGTEPTGTKHITKSQPVPAKVSHDDSGKLLRTEDPTPGKGAAMAAAKVPAKAPAKRAVKAAKSIVKSPVKPAVKASKSAAKSAAKLPVKGAKPPLKSLAKRAVKTVAKVPVKAAAKPTTKSAEKVLNKAIVRLPAKAAARLPLKSNAKPPIKVAAKPTSKSAAKTGAKVVVIAPEKTVARAAVLTGARAKINAAVKAVVKPGATTPVKPEAKLPVVAVSTSPAKALAPKRTPAIANSAPAPSPKPAQAAKSSLPAIKPAAELPVEPIPIHPAKALAPKRTPASVNPVAAPSPKPAQAAKPSLPAVKEPAPKPKVAKPAPSSVAKKLAP